MKDVILHFRVNPNEAAAIRERVGEGNLSDFLRSVVLRRVQELRVEELGSRMPLSSARRIASQELADG